MLVFGERGKPESLGENLSKQNREPTNSVGGWGNWTGAISASALIPVPSLLSSLCQACSLWYHAIHQSNPVMHQSFETLAPPPPPQFGLERGMHFLCKWKWVKSSFPGIKVSGAFPRTYCSTHSTPFVKQLIIASFPSFCNWSVNKKDQNVKIPYHWQNVTCNFSLTENVGPHMHVAIQIYISFDS